MHEKSIASVSRRHQERHHTYVPLESHLRLRRARSFCRSEIDCHVRNRNNLKRTSSLPKHEPSVINSLLSCAGQGNVCGYLRQGSLDPEKYAREPSSHREIFPLNYLLNRIFYDKNSTQVSDLAQFLHIYNIRHQSIFRYLRKNIPNLRFFSSLRHADILAHRTALGPQGSDQDWYLVLDSSLYDSAQDTWMQLSKQRKIFILQTLAKVAFTLATELYPEKREVLQKYIYVKHETITQLRTNLKIVSQKKTRCSKTGNIFLEPQCKRIQDEDTTVEDTPLCLQFLKFDPYLTDEPIDPHRLWVALLHTSVANPDPRVLLG